MKSASVISCASAARRKMLASDSFTLVTRRTPFFFAPANGRPVFRFFIVISNLKRRVLMHKQSRSSYNQFNTATHRKHAFCFTRNYFVSPETPKTCVSLHTKRVLFHTKRAKILRKYRVLFHTKRRKWSFVSHETSFVSHETAHLD